MIYCVLEICPDYVTHFFLTIRLLVGCFMRIPDDSESPQLEGCVCTTDAEFVVREKSWYVIFLLNQIDV